MRQYLLLSLALLTQPLWAAELAIPEEQAAVAAIAEGFFENPPEWTTRKEGKALVWSNSPLTIRITVNEAGSAVEYFSNGLPMTNARIAKLAALKNLKKVGFDHSGQWHYKEIPMEEFSGAGWEALTASSVEEVKIGGSHMSVPAELALSQMQNLRRLYLGHVPVSAEGIAAIGQHATLVSLRIGAQHNTIKGLSWYEAIPQLIPIPTLREITVDELFLTWDNSLGAIAEKGKHLKRIVFGNGSVIFPEDAERLKAALPETEIVLEPYHDVLHGRYGKFYGPRLKGLMTPEEFARLEELAKSAQ